jgi:hypothetical protein
MWQRRCKMLSHACKTQPRKPAGLLRCDLESTHLAFPAVSTALKAHKVRVMLFARSG